MEIIYCKQGSRELFGSTTHPPGKYRKLQFENFRVEARKRKLETKNHIRKREYWIRDLPSCIQEIVNKSEPPKS